MKMQRINNGGEIQSNWERTSNGKVHNESYLREQADQFYPVHIVLARRRVTNPSWTVSGKLDLDPALKKA